MHEFRCASVLSCCGHGRAFDEAEACGPPDDASTPGQPQQQPQCLALMVQCSPARGDLDNARIHLNRLETCSVMVTTSDWVSNADRCE